jgi:hypothetical protein
VSAVLAEAPSIRDGGLGGAALGPPPGWLGPAAGVDEVPDSFRTAPFTAERYLADWHRRTLGPADSAENLAVRHRNSQRPTWEACVKNAETQAFAAAHEAVVSQFPDLTIFNTTGRSAGLFSFEIEDYLQAKKPFMLLSTIDRADLFLAIRGSGLWAAAAIAIFDLHDMAVAVASGQAVAVSSNDYGFLSLEGGPWFPITDVEPRPELLQSCIMPPDTSSYRVRLLGSSEMTGLEPVYGMTGAGIMLNGVVLGAISAGIQPPCHPWDACVAPIAAAAGCAVSPIDELAYLGVSELHDTMLHTLRTRELYPSLVIARHKFAARQLVRRVREYPA